MKLNPLLGNEVLPGFAKIKAHHVEPAIEEILKTNLAQIEVLLASEDEPSWDNFVSKIEILEDRLSQSWSTVSHLNSVCNNEKLREAYNACVPKMSAYSSKLGQNAQLYGRYKQVLKSQGATLDIAQQQDLKNQIQDFELSGVSLPEEQKQRVAEIKIRLSELSSKFSENVLDSTMSWSKHIGDLEMLSGLPDSALAQAKLTAEENGLTGYMLTLDIPSYLPLMTYAENRSLREEIYQAYVTRASDRSANDSRWDNKEIIDEILRQRYEMAKLLGYDNYAEFSLAKKMAESPGQVLNFMEKLVQQAQGEAEKEFQTLISYAKQELGIEHIQAWDIAFLSEKLRQQRYNISAEEVRAYFPLDKVLEGMFNIAKHLYGITIVEKPEVDVWHENVRYFELHSEGECIAGFYADLFVRKNKKGGAWMAECRVRRKLTDGSIQKPIAYLTCNFTPAGTEDPSLLTHNELTTLFHEFGHALHHMLSKVDYAGVSGINGVAWDAVELPSQLMENWCWQAESLSLISSHYQTGECLPEELLEKMLAAKNFQAGMQLFRQLEYASFDFRLHLDYLPGQPDIVQNILDSVRSQVALYSVPEFNRFQNSFSHIFAGGYGAGYYSYKWAEVLAADVFEKFIEDGFLEKSSGLDFCEKILQCGGARPAMDLFIDYRGREPKIDALLRSTGIQTT